MMAKMFYTMEETKAALGKTEEDIKQLSKEGRLREFRDGPRLMFKADQVETLKNDLGGGGAGSGAPIDLGPSDSGAPIGLADSRGASGAGVSLGDADLGPSPGAGMTLKEDTALAADVGLSGSVGAMPSPGHGGPGGTGAGLSGTGSGINIFSGDDLDQADPGAQTAISGTVHQDQINLEGVGSGSGLLDLTRESDDTSLGAGVLDEIATGSARSADTGVTAGLEEPADRAPGRIITPPVMVEAHDPMATALGGASLGAVVVLLFGAFLLICALVGVRPDILQTVVGAQSQPRGVGVIAAMMLIPPVIFFIIGLIVAKSAQKR